MGLRSRNQLLLFLFLFSGISMEMFRPRRDAPRQLPRIPIRLPLLLVSKPAYLSSTVRNRVLHRPLLFHHPTPLPPKHSNRPKRKFRLLLWTHARRSCRRKFHVGGRGRDPLWVLLPSWGVIELRVGPGVSVRGRGNDDGPAGKVIPTALRVRCGVLGG